jgi:beta-phosphoglucomutase
MVPRAVLFDFDGVIADTENHHVVAWQRTLTALGWLVADEVAARSAEMDDRQFLAELFAQRGVLGGDMEGWVRKKQSITVELIRNAPRLYPGVIELVGRLQSRVRLAVVSDTWRENVATLLASVRLSTAFEIIIGKEDVTHVKPNPEAYLLALARLGIKAAEAVALEDSSSGLTAARSAGVPYIAVGHRREFGAWVGDAAYISGFEPVSGLIQQLGLTDSRG